MILECFFRGVDYVFWFCAVFTFAIKAEDSSYDQSGEMGTASERNSAAAADPERE